MAGASKYETLADAVVAAVGGASNVESVTHCATRLRFRLKDRDLADRPAVEAIQGVITVQEAGGQFQVVIGNTVNRVYEAVVERHQVAVDAAGPASGGFMARLIDLVTSIFTPFLWVLAGTGLLKAMLILVSTIYKPFATTSTYEVLFVAGDAFFQFLPLALAITSAKKFKANMWVALSIGSSLLYVNLIVFSPLDPLMGGVTMETWAKTNDLTFFGIPMTIVSYVSSVIPIIVAVYAQSWLERLLDRVLPDSIRNFTAPALTVAVIVPVTLLVIGPVTTLLGEGVVKGLQWVWDLSPEAGGFILAGAWQILVIFGLHWALIPVFAQELATNGGFTLLSAVLFAPVLAQAAAAFAVFLRTKNRELKQVAGPAALSGFVAGITEPAIYGVTLRLKKPFVYACIAGAIGGATSASAGAAVKGFAIPGLLTIPLSTEKGNVALHLIGVGVAVGLAFTLTMVLGFKDLPAAPAADVPATPDAVPSSTVTSPVQIVAPVEGAVVQLVDVADKVFSSGALGVGFGVVPASGRISAPISGVVVSAMPHAYGIRSDEGIEVLVHVGIDTVKLNGAGFVSAVTQGQRVAVGDSLVTVDLDALRGQDIDATTVVIVTNGDDLGSVSVTDGVITVDSTLASVTP